MNKGEWKGWEFSHLVEEETFLWEREERQKTFPPVVALELRDSISIRIAVQ